MNRLKLAAVLTLLPFLLAATPANDYFKRRAARDATVSELVADGGKIIAPGITEKHLRIAADLSRYPMPSWRERPVALVMPEVWFLINVCRGNLECPVGGVWHPAFPDVVLLSARVPLDRQLDILVHELVHYLQGRSGWLFSTSCGDHVAHESEAYAVQHLFVVLIQKIDRGFTTPDLSCRATIQRGRAPNGQPRS